MKRPDYAETRAILAGAVVIGFALALFGILVLMYITTGGIP